MADFTPIVINAGADKVCEFCGLPIKHDTKYQAGRAADAANGLLLDSIPVLAMHANCLRGVLVWAAKSMKGCAGDPILLDVPGAVGADKNVLIGAMTIARKEAAHGTLKTHIDSLAANVKANPLKDGPAPSLLAEDDLPKAASKKTEDE